MNKIRTNTPDGVSVTYAVTETKRDGFKIAGIGSVMKGGTPLLAAALPDAFKAMVGTKFATKEALVAAVKDCK